MSHSNKIEQYAFLFLLNVLLLIALYLLYPFMTPVVFGAVFAVLFYPLHKKYMVWTKQRKDLSSLLSVLSVLFLLIIPIASTLTLVMTQLSSLINSATAYQNSISFSDIIHAIQSKIPYWGSTINKTVGYDVNLVPAFKNGIAQLAQKLAQYSPYVIMGTASFFIDLSIMVISMYYLFRDGEGFFQTFIRLTPVKDKYEHALAQETRLMIQAIFYGSFLTSLIQAILSTLGFYFLHIEGFLVWGILTFFMSFLPIVGTGGVFVPLIVALVFKGETTHAIILTVYGVVIIGTVDNLLKPILVRQKNVHQMLLFLSIFGGMSVFGVIGLFLGPMLIAMLTSVVNIYERDFVNKQKKKEDLAL